MSQPIALDDSDALGLRGSNLRGTDGAAHVAVSSLPPFDDYHALVTPLLAGTTTGPLQIDGADVDGVSADLVPHYILVTVNPGDDVTAATRLSSGKPEVLMVRPGETLEITSESAITDLYFIAVDATAAATTYTGGSYIMPKADTDLADWLAEMGHLTFASADTVRRASVAVSDVYGTNYATVSVQGVSYA